MSVRDKIKELIAKNIKGIDVSTITNELIENAIKFCDKNYTNIEIELTKNNLEKFFKRICEFKQYK